MDIGAMNLSTELSTVGRLYEGYGIPRSDVSYSRTVSRHQGNSGRFYRGSIKPSMEPAISSAGFIGGSIQPGAELHVDEEMRQPDEPRGTEISPRGGSPVEPEIPPAQAPQAGGREAMNLDSIEAKTRKMQMQWVDEPRWTEIPPRGGSVCGTRCLSGSCT